ncbi:zinc ribbon domain-containing protein [Intestinibacter sp.]|uniref:zinc ribbon domain-containing protein n=1 Tax=Intestinibacter sp. TaxID=1965304 RepID=UPI003F162FF3
MKKEKICRQCGEIIEKNAKTCLKCGADQRNFFGKHQVFTIFIVVFILICISIGIILNKLNSINNSESAMYTQSEFDSIWGDIFEGFGENISVTAEELAKEYESDKNGTDDYLLYEYIEVTGVIENIEKIDDITLRVNLKTDSDYKLYCYFDKDYNEKFEELEKYTSGKEITAIGYLERNGKKLKLTDAILSDWEEYYSFDDNFNIDADLENLLNEIKKKDQSISLSEKNIMSFDSDILDYGYSYEEIIDIMTDISQGEVEILYIDENNRFTSKEIELEINSKEISIKLDKDTSCFDENLVYAINQELKKNNYDKMFYYSYRDYDEYCGISNIAYSTQEDIDKINKVLKNSDLDIDQFDKEISTKSL